MRRAILFPAGLVLCAALCGCTFKKHIAPAAYHIDDAVAASLKLNSSTPVALKNAAPKAGEQLLGEWVSWHYLGDLHQFTDSAVGTAKDALAKQRVSIDNNAPRSLEFAVYKASVTAEGNKYGANVWLRVKTGSGVTREYQTKEVCIGYAITGGFEYALTYAIEQMFKDEQILSYLQK
jgi:hypothetical protein